MFFHGGPEMPAEVLVDMAFVTFSCECSFSGGLDFLLGEPGISFSPPPSLPCGLKRGRLPVPQGRKSNCQFNELALLWVCPPPKNVPVDP